MINELKDNKIAILIDAENVSEKYIKYILDEISNYGIPTYKRIYGDWTDDSSRRWKKVLLTYSITPVQQFSYTFGKNASDSALIIDAMDILYTGNVQGFCIVSSDSDFTRLATRLREAGKMVIGMGEKKTPKALISACDKFIYLEVLIPKEYKPLRKTKLDTRLDKAKSLKEKQNKDNQNIPIFESPQDIPSEQKLDNSTIEDESHVGDNINDIVKAIKAIINEISNDDGLASLADVGNALNRRFPEFDARNYGFVKFSHFMGSLKGFELIKERPEGNNGTIRMFVKII